MEKSIVQGAGEESGPKSQGFQIHIDKPELIFKALQDGVSGELGTHLLQDPLREIKIKATKEPNGFNLVAKIRLSLGASMDRGIHERDLIKTIVGEYPEAKERGGNYIIQLADKTQLVIGRGSVGLDEIMISTGCVEDFIDKSIQLVPEPKLENEEFNRATTSFIGFVEKAVDKIYEIDKKDSPDEIMTLHSPKQGMNGGLGGLGGLFGETKTPEELLGKIAVEKPNVTFEQIGGLGGAKREVQGLAFALKNPELYLKWETKPPKGIILFGEPGTGKTLLAKALASQADAQFFHVKSSDIASKWYGDSEKIVSSIFELANQSEKKTIIFFDEIDAIAPFREGAHEATHRVISTLLENMDGMASNNNVMVVASTNRLNSIEPALLRAGRFDRWVEAPLPDEEGRKQIFTIHMNIAQEIAKRELFNNVNLEVLVSKTEKLSGADISELIRRTLEEKVRQEGMGNGVNLVSTEDVLKELENYEKIRKTRKQMGFVPQEKEK